MQPGLSLATQAWRFIVTGGLSAIVDYSLYVGLHAIGLQRDLAKIVSFIAGTTTAYLINRRWTFQAPPSTARFIAVCALYATTFVVQVGINHVLYRVWEGEWWCLAVAFFIAQGMAVVMFSEVRST